MTELVTALTEVKSLIENGWTQGTYKNDKTGCYCLDGAIREVAVWGPDLERHLQGLPFDNEVYKQGNILTTDIERALVESLSEDELSDTLDRLRIQTGMSALETGNIPGVVVVYWNDFSGRTKAEVLSLLDRAIARASNVNG